MFVYLIWSVIVGSDEKLAGVLNKDEYFVHSIIFHTGHDDRSVGNTSSLRIIPVDDQIRVEKLFILPGRISPQETLKREEHDGVIFFLPRRLP